MLAYTRTSPFPRSRLKTERRTRIIHTATRFLIAVLTWLTSLAFAQQPTPIELLGIHNSFRATDRIICGSQPEGDAAFLALASAGVKTIISVDGAKPDTKAAKRYGLRYVHLPFGYDSIPKQRVAELVHATKAASGQIFVHCHHGKHRGPAAVSVICQAINGWTPAQGIAWLRQAGTALDYPGLYRAVQDFQPVTNEQLAHIGPLPEIAKSTALVDTMVAIDEQFDALKAAQKTAWKVRPAEAATLLWEQIRELARNDDTINRPEAYRSKLAEAETAAAALRTSLIAPTPDSRAFDEALQKTTQSCTACHKAFRNAPR